MSEEIKKGPGRPRKKLSEDEMEMMDANIPESDGTTPEDALPNVECFINPDEFKVGQIYADVMITAINAEVERCVVFKRVKRKQGGEVETVPIFDKGKVIKYEYVWGEESQMTFEDFSSFIFNRTQSHRLPEAVK